MDKMSEFICHLLHCVKVTHILHLRTRSYAAHMALGAFYAAKKGKNEEVEHVEEAADPGKLRVVNKKVEAQASKDTKTSEKKSKATEKAIDVAKSKKNPVNLKPVLTGDKVNNA